MSLKIIIFCQSILYLHFSMQDKIKWSCAEYKLRKRTKKKREQNIYNNFLFRGSISKAFWNNASVKLHPVKSSIPMQHVYKRQCFDAWTFKSNHDYRRGPCILREPRTNRISQINEAGVCSNCRGNYHSIARI